MKEKIKKTSLLIIGIIIVLAFTFWVGYNKGKRKSLEEFFQDISIEMCDCNNENKSDNYCILNTPLGEYYIYDIGYEKEFEELLEKTWNEIN